MADVYRGHDLVLERAVAVKVVRGTDDEDARRFAAEVRAMATLNHPHIVRLFDAGTHAASPFLVMELVEGSALPTLLAEGPLEPERVAAIGAGLAAGLDHAHGLGIVHRDVKPSNVLLDNDGGVRLSDFGIARLVDTTRVTSTGMTAGTAAYLAPEQLSDADVGPPADVYACGLVLLEALTGQREFTGTPVEAAMARLQRDPDVPNELPAPWRDLLPAMTARAPEERPTAADVADRLSDGHHSNTQPVGGRYGAKRGRSGARATRTRTSASSVVTVAAVVGLLALALVLVLGNVGDDAPQEPPPPPPEQDTTLPAELDDALRQLEEAVSP